MIDIYLNDMFRRRVDQENNNEIMLPGDFSLSWDPNLRIVSVSEEGTPTGW